MSNNIEVCFSPKLFNCINIHTNCITVIVDILRATTSICTAFEYGVKSIIPIATTEEALQFKKRGYLVAAEREGQRLEFADYGNSAFDYMNDTVKEKTIAYTTTNGIQAVLLAKDSEKVVIGAFANLTALWNWLLNENKNVIILCSGWKNSFCLEDTLFAGALAEKLLTDNRYFTSSDSTYAAISLWKNMKDSLPEYIDKMSHVERLRGIGKEDDINYSFQIDTCKVVPVLDSGELIKGS